MQKVITDISGTGISGDDTTRMKKVIDAISGDDKNIRYNEDDINSMKNVLTNISKKDITVRDKQNIEKVYKEISEGDINNLNMVIKDITENDINSMKTVIDNKREALMLTDAGIAFNSPYPLVLHPARKIELILSFEFSAPDPTDLSDWPFSVRTLYIILIYYHIIINRLWVY